MLKGHPQKTNVFVWDLWPFSISAHCSEWLMPQDWLVLVAYMCCVLGGGGECWYSENLILLDGVIRGAQVRGKLCPLLWADFLKSEALQYFLNMSNVFPWLVSEMQSRLVHPFYKIGKGGKAISSWLHSQLAAELRTEIASWAAKSAT